MEDGSPAETWEMSNNSWQQNVKLGLEIKHNRSKNTVNMYNRKKKSRYFWKHFNVMYSPTETSPVEQIHCIHFQNNRTGAQSAKCIMSIAVSMALFSSACVWYSCNSFLFSLCAFPKLYKKFLQALPISSLFHLFLFSLMQMQ